MKEPYENHRTNYQNNYGHFWAQLWGKCIHIILLIALLIFPLQFGMIKSRSHYLRGPKLQIPWFLGFWTHHQAPKPTLSIFGDTRTPKQNQETPWNMFDVFVNLGINIVGNLERLCIFCFWNFEYLIICQKLWRWESEDDENWLNKISQILDMNFISIKKHGIERW